MTAKILPFQKANGKLPHAREGDLPVPRVRSRQEIFEQVSSDTIADWQRYATKNRLNEFILSKLPAYTAVASTDYDFVNDLNLLSSIEQRLGLAVIMYYPGTSDDNAHGWSAAFNYDSELFSMSVTMPNESSARALNILLYQAFKIRV